MAEHGKVCDLCRRTDADQLLNEYTYKTASNRSWRSVAATILLYIYHISTVLLHNPL